MIRRSKSPPDRASHEYRSELTVSGYAREHSISNVPDALVILMVQFYDLWLRHCFTAEEAAKLMALSNGQQLSFPMDSFTMNGTELRIYLRARCTFYGNKEHVAFSWRIAVPYCVGFISCIIMEERAWLPQRSWIRVVKENNASTEGAGTRHKDIINLERSPRSLHLTTCNLEEELRDSISLYVDINQIKYNAITEAHHQDFDETQKFEIRKRQWKWKILGRSLEELQSNQDKYRFCAKSTRDRLWSCHVSHACISSFPWRLTVHYHGCTPLPLDVSSVGFTVIVKSNIGGKRFENQFVLSMQGGRYIHQEMDLEWDTESILKASSIDLIITMEAFKVFDHDQEELAQADWRMHGILPCKDVVEHLGVNAECDVDIGVDRDPMREGVRQIQIRALLNRIFQKINVDGIAEDVLEEQIAQGIKSKMLMAAGFDSNSFSNNRIIISEEAEQRMWQRANVLAAEVKEEMNNGFLSNAYDIEMDDDGMRRYSMKVVEIAADKAISALEALFYSTSGF